MSRAAFSVVMNGRMPSLFASHASANARLLSVSSSRPAVGAARLRRDAEQVVVHVGRVLEAGDRRGLADPAGVEADHVVLPRRARRRRRSSESRT